jgi:ATP-dependent Clp protease ATP-binding subunit ClpC
MLDRLTERAQKAMASARNEAQDLGHASLEPEHVLLGILEGGGSALRILMETGVDTDRLLEDLLSQIEADPDATQGPQSIGPRAHKALLLAMEESSHLQRDWVGTEHILLGVIGEGGPSSKVLARHGAVAESIRAKARSTISAD